jgi:hypothetical protein
MRRPQTEGLFVVVCLKNVGEANVSTLLLGALMTPTAAQ